MPQNQINDVAQLITIFGKLYKENEGTILDQGEYKHLYKPIFDAFKNTKKSGIQITGDALKKIISNPKTTRKKKRKSRRTSKNKSTSRSKSGSKSRSKGTKNYITYYQKTKKEQKK